MRKTRVEPQPRVKRSVSIDADVETEALEIIGERGFSGYVNEALRRENQRQRVLARVARYEAEHGPIPDELQAKADKAVRTWLASSITGE